jgi:hypothetical protein
MEGVLALASRRPLRPPVSADNSCHEAIFVNYASGTVAPTDAEVVQVGDAIWQRT